MFFPLCFFIVSSPTSAPARLKPITLLLQYVRRLKGRYVWSVPSAVLTLVIGAWFVQHVVQMLNLRACCPKHLATIAQFVHLRSIPTLRFALRAALPLLKALTLRKRLREKQTRAYRARERVTLCPCRHPRHLPHPQRQHPKLIMDNLYT